MNRKRPITIEIGETIEVFPDGVFEGKVVKYGNGAMIKSYKKFIGEEAVVIIKDKMKNKSNNKLREDGCPPELVEDYSWK